MEKGKADLSYFLGLSVGEVVCIFIFLKIMPFRAFCTFTKVTSRVFKLINFKTKILLMRIKTLF